MLPTETNFCDYVHCRASWHIRYHEEMAYMPSRPEISFSLPTCAQFFYLIRKVHKRYLTVRIVLDKDHQVSMVGKYQRTSNRLSWREEDMKSAIKAVETNQMGWLKASKTFNVPFGTLRRRANNRDTGRHCNKIATGFKKGYMGGNRATFSAQQEYELVEHLKNMETRFFGITTIELRKLAFQWAQKNNIPNNFNKEKEEAGWDWLRGFLNRNSTLSLRTPESTSAARARAFNKPQIGKYFDLLAVTMDEVKYDPTKIFNMDESGLTTVPSKNSKILAQKGKKQVGVITSAERGHHLTVVCSFSAAGMYVPPAFIFPRKNMKKELMDNAPAGSVGFTQDHGWMDTNTFVKWLQHFIKYVKPTKEEKVLLLLDGHISHKSLEAQELAKKNGIIMFCFPPHCTHRVQPLDVSFFGPLTTYFNQELNMWLKTHPDRTVTHYQIAGLFKNAYQKAATLSIAEKGFSTTGIFPFNSNVFPDWMFAPAEVTNRHNPNPVDQEDILTASTSTRDAEQPLPTEGKKTAEELPNVSQDVIERNSATEQSAIPLDGTKTDAATCIRHVSLTELSPVPTSTTLLRRKTTKNRGKIGVLNTTPEIQTLKEIAVQKEITERKKSARQVKKKLKLDLRDDLLEKDDGDSFELETDEDDDAACIFCNELFSLSKNNELWLRCQKCKKWAHAECAGLSKKTKNFICDLCC